MKKTLSIFLVCVCLVGLSACDNRTEFPCSSEWQAKSFEQTEQCFSQYIEKTLEIIDSFGYVYQYKEDAARTDKKAYDNGNYEVFIKLVFLDGFNLDLMFHNDTKYGRMYIGLTKDGAMRKDVIPPNDYLLIIEQIKRFSCWGDFGDENTFRELLSKATESAEFRKALVYNKNEITYEEIFYTVYMHYSDQWHLGVIYCGYLSDRNVIVES